ARRRQQVANPFVARHGSDIQQHEVVLVPTESLPQLTAELKVRCRLHEVGRDPSRNDRDLSRSEAAGKETIGCPSRRGDYLATSSTQDRRCRPWLGQRLRAHAA
ncbi:MAG: hypothetical protein ACK56I_21695, partial [bacterium]